MSMRMVIVFKRSWGMLRWSRNIEVHRQNPSRCVLRRNPRSLYVLCCFWFLMCYVQVGCVSTRRLEALPWVGIHIWSIFLAERMSWLFWFKHFSQVGQRGKRNLLALQRSNSWISNHAYGAAQHYAIVRASRWYSRTFPNVQWEILPHKPNFWRWGL